MPEKIVVLDGVEYIIHTDEATIIQQKRRIEELEGALLEAMERHQSTIESEWSPGRSKKEWMEEAEFRDHYDILAGRG